MIVLRETTEKGVEQATRRMSSRLLLCWSTGSAANRFLESEWRAPGAVNARGMPRAFAASRMYVLKAPQKTQRDTSVVSVG